MVGEDSWESFYCKKIKPVNPKGISFEYSLEGLMLKLKLQYFGHLIRRANSVEKTLMLAKIEGKRRRGWQRMRCSDGITITDSMDMSLNKLQTMLKDREAWCAIVHGITNSWTWLSNWTTTTTEVAQQKKLLAKSIHWTHGFLLRAHTKLMGPETEG